MSTSFSHERWIKIIREHGDMYTVWCRLLDQEGAEAAKPPVASVSAANGRGEEPHDASGG